MITPEEARALVVAGEPARKAERDRCFYEDCERAAAAIRVSAGAGNVCCSISDVGDVFRLTEYLKQCGFTAYRLSDASMYVWWK